jgi:hypothetical protein
MNTMTTREAMDVVEIEIDVKRTHANNARKDRPALAAQLEQEANAMEIILNLARNAKEPATPFVIDLGEALKRSCKR